jgi:hypothetical protein
LRVKWREGEELTQVKLFTHEQGEDEGRDNDMLRDAHDERSEGMMHKQRVLGVAVDDDEDMDDINEKEFKEPPAIDFSDLGDELLQKNYHTRGGNLKTVTEQQKLQDERENREVMAVYLDESDIPPTPKEAPQEDVPDNGKDMGLPTDPKVYQRWQEIVAYGPKQAAAYFIQRAEGEKAQTLLTSPASLAGVQKVTELVNGVKRAAGTQQQSSSQQQLDTPMPDAPNTESQPLKSATQPPVNTTASLKSNQHHQASTPKSAPTSKQSSRSKPANHSQQPHHQSG